MHSYQSYLWNCAASERLSAFPKTHAVAGDLVLVERAGPAPQGRERRHDFAEVRVVTAAEEAARSVGIAAVVLPLVGKYASLPENAVGRVFRDLAAADGIDLDAPAHSVGEFSLAGQPGAYRKLVHVPERHEADAALARGRCRMLVRRVLPPDARPWDERREP